MTPRKRLIKCLLVIVLLIGAPDVARANSNIELVQKWYSILDSRPFNIEKAASLVTDNLEDHNEDSLFASDKEIHLYIQSEFAKGAPDSHHQLKLVEALDDNRVLVYWRRTGTHSSDFFDVAASHNQFDIAGIAIFRISEGKIAEIWYVEDVARLLEQLGVIN